MANSEFKPLSRSFYDSNTVLVAKKLLGKLVVRKLNGQVISGRIVETEAYTSGEHDPASHACRGMTERNKVMFGKNGISYVYFTYGMYFMFNVVAKKKTEDAGAVLIRALEPIKGIKIMELNRHVKNELNITNGPGKLTKALVINKKLNGIDLTKKGKLYITNFERRREEISASVRIGISFAIDKKWRFYLKRNKFVSKKE